MISKFSELIKYIEDYLTQRPLIGDIIVDKYEIVSIYDIGRTLVGTTGVGESITVDIKLKGTVEKDWSYLWTVQVEYYCGITLKGRNLKHLK